MSGISQIASKLLGGGGRKGTTAGKTGTPGGTRGGTSTGSSSGTDAAIGRGVRGLVSKLRR